MQLLALQQRPYRSHLRPSCLACRKRKSRCKIGDEPNASACLMCRAHDTECIFPDRAEREPRRRLASARASSSSSSTAFSAASTVVPAPLQPPRTASVLGESVQPQTLPLSVTSYAQVQPTPLSSDDAAQETHHIVGPANTTDSQVLADYLSAISHDTTRMRMVRSVPASRSKPVLFATVQRRPVGVQPRESRAREKLDITEQLLAPHAETLMELFFARNNACLPLLDYASFRYQYHHARDKISPALLVCLYAHSMVYWRFCPTLSLHRPPDQRFIWNLANEGLHSELHFSPGISTVTAILLNVGGRPTTSLLGNGVQLGAAVSLAHSLGLNRDPLPWDIPEAEKLLRMKMWWALVIHDKWSSLAHGTPPHIHRAQYDVPAPQPAYFADHFSGDGGEHAQDDAISVFMALYGLTEVLDHYLQHLYRVDRSISLPSGHSSTANLEYKLNHWISQLSHSTARRIITRGSGPALDVPGAPNLRLAYLAVQLLARRIALEDARDGSPSSDREPPADEMLAGRYMDASRTAEDIVALVQDLGSANRLGGFWLPMAAFVFASTATFLLRCALETEDESRSGSLRLVAELLANLRAHRDQAGWDLGDICLAQYEEVVERLMTMPPPGTAGREGAVGRVLEAWEGLQGLADGPVGMGLGFADELLFQGSGHF